MLSNARASDVDPVNTDTAGPGTSAKFTREGHDHGITGGADGTVLNGNGAPAGNSGKDGDTYRDDETGAWYKKASGAWSAVLYTPEAVSTPKNVEVDYSIGEGHDVDDASFNPWEGNIYRVDRDGLIDGFSMWANPQVIVEYQGFIQRMTKHGDEDYRPVSALLEADNNITTTGAGIVELPYDYSTPFEVSEGDYLWVGVTVGATGATRGRQQADADVVDTLGVLTFEDHSKFTGTPTTADNLWHMNPDNYSYRQEIRGAFVSTDELVVTKGGILVYSGPGHVDIEGPVTVVDSTDKATLTLNPDRAIVSEDTPPDPALVADEDKTKLYFHVNADGAVKSISYVREVDPHIFSLTSEEYTPATQQYRGFRATGNYGYLVPRRNIVVMEHTTDVIALFDLKFEDGNTEPFDYSGYVDGLTLYRRLKTSTGDWSHHNFARDASDHFNFQGTTGAAFFGSNHRYDVIIRTGQHGDGTSATVPEANRLVPYPGGLKREYLPTADNIDNITQLYDIIRQETTTTAPAPDAADVAVDASGFDGNLAITDTNVQLLAQAVDDLSLGSEVAETDLFLAPIGARTDVNIAGVVSNQLSITETNILINRGEYTIENDASALQQIVIPEAGTYTIKASLLVHLTTASATGIRDYIEVSIIVLRAAAVFRTTSSSGYMRGNLLHPEYVPITYTADFEVGDLILLGAKENTNDTSTYTVGGGNSFISVIREAVGAAAAAAGASGAQSDAVAYERQEITPSPNPYPLTVSGNFDSGFATVWNPFDIVDIPKDDFESMTLVVGISGRFDVTFHLDRFDLIENIGFTDQIDFSQWDNADTNRIPAMHWSGGFNATSTKYPVISRPRYGYVNGLRSAGAAQCLIVFRESVIGGVEHFQAVSIIVFGTIDMTFRGGSIVRRSA